jgi:Lrp/AsnC family transcriptional regulator, leucine-responsive regulatory protein
MSRARELVVPCALRLIHARNRLTGSCFLRSSAAAGIVACVPAPVHIDDIDRQILDLLSDDARRTITDIAMRVNLSPAPVKRRIDRLEQLGVIAGYTLRLDHTKIGPSIDAFTELRFAGDTDVDDVIAACTEVPEVREVFTMAGDPDALVRIRVESVQHLKQVVNNLRRSGRITGTKTLMVLDRWARMASDQRNTALRSGR